MVKISWFSEKTFSQGYCINKYIYLLHEPLQYCKQVKS